MNFRTPFFRAAEHGCQCLAVMHLRRSVFPRRDQFGVTIHVDMILVPVDAFAILFGPACVRIFLRKLVRFFALLYGDCTFLDECILFPLVPLNRNSNKGRIHNLP